MTAASETLTLRMEGDRNRANDVVETVTLRNIFGLVTGENVELASMSHRLCVSPIHDRATALTTRAYQSFINVVLDSRAR